MNVPAARSASFLLAAAALAASAAIGAPSALADPNTITCEPGQIVIDNQCSAPPNQTAAGSDSNGGDHSGDSGHNR